MRSRFQFAAGVAGLALAALLNAAVHADLAADLATPSRAEEDRARDAGRKPAEVLAWLGIGSGMTVMDLVASGGWYTEVLSIAVGPEGTVYAQNPPAFLQFRDGFYDKAMAARLADDRLPNVVRLDKDVHATGLEPGSLDAAITALNFHDIYNPPTGTPESAAAFLAAVQALLKPGGVLGLDRPCGRSRQRQREPASAGRRCRTAGDRSRWLRDDGIRLAAQSRRRPLGDGLPTEHPRQDRPRALQTREAERGRMTAVIP